MNSEHLHKKLIAAARALPVNAEVPYRFEKRVMANLRSAPRPEFSAWLAEALLKPTIFFLGVMMLTGVWTFVHPASPGGESDTPEIENAIWAPLDSLGEVI